MIRSPQEAAQALVNALSEARSVFALQNQAVEAARLAAETTEHRFLSLLETHQTDHGGADSKQQRREWQERLRNTFSRGTPNPQAELERLSETCNLSRRWEQALCDSQIAVMRLYALPAARESAERIAENLRNMRMLQVAELPTAFPFAPPPTGFDAETRSDDERKEQRISFTLDFMRGMGGHVDEMMKSLQAKSERTEEFLNQAYEEAESLASRLGA